MPPGRDRCDECGRSSKVCPECGGTHISVDLVGDGGVDGHARSTTPSPDHATFARRAPSGDRYSFQHVCWDCGWKEQREVTVEVVGE